jgi:hypothetical protein
MPPLAMLNRFASFPDVCRTLPNVLGALVLGFLSFLPFRGTSQVTGISVETFAAPGTRCKQW